MTEATQALLPVTPELRLDGYNGAISQAIRALRYLAENDRPSEGERFPNSACCYLVAEELERTMRNFEPAITAWNTRISHSLPGDVGMREAKTARECAEEASREHGLSFVYAVAETAARIALTPSLCPGDGMLRAHFTRMMEAAANYLEPTTYVARHPQHGLNGPSRFTTEFPMPDDTHSDSAKADINGRRDEAFIRDIIYMLDGPEQRAALTPSALSKNEAEQGLEGLGDALHALSAKLFVSNFLDDDANHAAYEKVVTAFQALGVGDLQREIHVAGNGQVLRVTDVETVAERLNADPAEASADAIRLLRFLAALPSALSGEPVQKGHELPRDVGARAIELLREYMDAEEIDDVDARSSELGACRFSVRAFLDTVPSALSGDAGEGE